MIFGVDFGTTFTVVSWVENESLNFLNWNGQDLGKDFLLPTEINGKKNLKRVLAENQEGIFEHVREFFMQLNIKIEEKVGIVGIKQCVLTVPVRFNDIARNAIKTAAISAGFHVLKLLVEPVAAAIYALKNKMENGYYVVYDLGGGTFDATLLKLHDGVFQILSVTGLVNFGGIDIDNLLSSINSISIDEARAYKERGYFTPREIEVINQLLEPTYNMIETMLTQNNLSGSDIRMLVLAGGSSRLTMIGKKLSNDYVIARNDLSSDLLVAAGAGIHAHAISCDNKNHLLIDAVSFDLGIETLGDQMEVLIAKNSPLPAMHSQYFQSVQGSNVLINVLQGVDCKASEAISLAKFEIASLEPFEVVFMLDCDGILAIKIGDQVYVVSAKFGMIKEDAQLKNMLQYARNNAVTIEQKAYLQYLEQAREIELSEHARSWLIAKYEKLFAN